MVKRILIIHESRLVAAMLSQLLNLDGYIAEIIQKSELSNEKIIIFNPDVIIIDLSIYKQKAIFSFLNLNDFITLNIWLFVLTDTLDIDNLILLNFFKKINVFHYDDDFDEFLFSLNHPSSDVISFSPKFSPSLSSRIKMLLRLTTCEIIVLKLVLKGHNNKFIANKLCRSEDTIKNHRKSIKLKLDVKGGKSALFSIFDSFS